MRRGDALIGLQMDRWRETVGMARTGRSRRRCEEMRSSPVYFGSRGSAGKQPDLTSKGNNKLVMTSVAFQDHIARTLLNHKSFLSDPLLRCKTKNSRNPQTTGGKKEEQRQEGREEREYVLGPAPPPLTLAQKMGLVASPVRRLTEQEWTQVKARSAQEGESEQPCAICREAFCLQLQVLLSCSHVFHRACLQAFERFSGRKCCPICRREQYETRVIHDAARLYRNVCATRIQACWRGYVARKLYRHKRKTVCPKDQQQRRKFFEAKLQELNDSFVQYCHTDTEAFLSDIDRSLSSSRRVFQQLERKHIPEPQEDDWERIRSQVTKRDVWDCPICLTPLTTESSPSSQQQQRCTVLLSCSHLFHQVCLDAFEAFAADTRPTCPLCRSVYHKKLI
ncbi:RING finger protein 32 [Aulostomus maculatus]